MPHDLIPPTTARQVAARLGLGAVAFSGVGSFAYAMGIAPSIKTKSVLSKAVLRRPLSHHPPTSGFRETTMADSEPRTQTQNVEYNERRLKYLDFIQMAVIYMVICFSTLYEFAKNNSGPLRPGVQTVEATVKAVVRPLCDRFQDVPFEILRFVDSKVDEYVDELDILVPSLVKQASSQARAVASEVQRAGFVEAARTGCKRLEPAAREMYEKYEPVAEEYAVAAWRRLNRLPLFPQVAEIAVPTVAYWADKYNRAVCFAAERGYPVSGYLPFVPLDRIAKVFDEAERRPAAANGEVATAQ